MLVVSRHDSISMQDAINAGQLRLISIKHLPFLISCFWNSVPKLKDHLNIQFMNMKLDNAFHRTL